MRLALRPRALHRPFHSICGCGARPRSAYSRPPPRRTASPQWIAQQARPSHSPPTYPQRALSAALLRRCWVGPTLSRRRRMSIGFGPLPRHCAAGSAPTQKQFRGPVLLGALTLARYGRPTGGRAISARRTAISLGNGPGVIPGRGGSSSS